MGQYHLTVNLDKHQFLDPHKLGDGLKLWEQVNSEGGTTAALFMLLAVSNGRGGGDLHTFVPGPDKSNPYRDGHYIEPEIVGSWGGDRIAVVGDYAEDTDLRPEHTAGFIYTLCRMSQAIVRGTVEEYREHWDDTKWGAGTKYGLTFEEGLVMARTWRDISDDMVPLLEEFCGVRFISKDGWRSKVRETNRYTVPSQTNGTRYTVTEFSDGSRTCTCKGFSFRKSCRHTSRVQNALDGRLTAI